MLRTVSIIRLGWAYVRNSEGRVKSAECRVQSAARS